MAQAMILPKLGNTVESAIILNWRAAIGAAVTVGDVLCEIETDKATLEVESTADGIVLAHFYQEGDEVPVLQNIAVVGQAGEAYAQFMPAATSEPIATTSPELPPINAGDQIRSFSASESTGKPHISPRAKHLAQRKGIDYADLSGSGPEGRIIERDIEAAIDRQAKLSPVAQKMLASGDFKLAEDPAAGARVTKIDLVPVDYEPRPVVNAVPLKGVRKTIAKRMLESMQSTAQLTLHRSAEASALQALRPRFKSSDESYGLRHVTLNDLIMFAVSRTLPAFPDLNALFEDNTVYQHEAVQLGMAVDTTRGLFVPVIRRADTLSLRALSAEAARLADACRQHKVLPDELTGGSFTVSNLGSLGVEQFTPILNPPQVAILGIGAIKLKPIAGKDGVNFVPHIGLSLTVNHQVVDGAPAARFLAKLAENLRDIDLLIMLETS